MNGIKLSMDFYHELVEPLVTPLCPGHGAGLIGAGSEVLGYDTELSEDHDYSARCFVFTDGYGEEMKEKLRRELHEKLPPAFRGYPTRVDICTAWEFFRGGIGFDPDRMTPYEWLSVPSQKLLELTSGKIFKSTEAIEHLREKVRTYPRDVLLYILAAQWGRIGQEMAFVGRCQDTGDILGSSILASRMVTYLMRLCFLYEGKYAPYWKWFGTAFKHIKNAERLQPVFDKILSAKDWEERESGLAEAYTILGEIHNASGLADPVEPGAVQYYTRPYLVAKVPEYQRVLLSAIKDPVVQGLPSNLGGVDQITDQTDFLGQVEVRTGLIRTWKQDYEFRW